MPSRRRKAPATISVKTAELARAVPQVVAHRVTRMALAGPVLSPRDRKEFSGMVAEKQTAFQQSWQAMFKEACRINQKLAADVTKSIVHSCNARTATQKRLAARTRKAAVTVARKGLDPIHRKATANAKRLARTKLIDKK